VNVVFDPSAYPPSIRPCSKLVGHQQVCAHHCLLFVHTNGAEWLENKVIAHLEVLHQPHTILNGDILY